ncbi:MAG: hypothetical protein LBI10_04825, partial [Deltaproteobacteria bacterium]|nr:hypothetical protein [Deltaproteobacteria bacterium]
IHGTAGVIADPAQLGEDNTAVLSVDLELGGIREPEGVAAALLAESGKPGPFGEKILEGPSRSFRDCWRTWEGASLSQEVSRSFFQPISKAQSRG